MMGGGGQWGPHGVNGGPCSPQAHHNYATAGQRNRRRPVPVPVVGCALQQLALNVHVKHSDLT